MDLATVLNLQEMLCLAPALAGFVGGGFFGSGGSKSKTKTRKTTKTQEQGVQGSGAAVNLQGQGNEAKVLNMRTDQGAVKEGGKTARKSVEAAAEVSEQSLKEYNRLARTAFGTVDRKVGEAADMTQRATEQAMDFAQSATKSEASQTLEKMATYGVPAVALSLVGIAWLANR